MIFGQLLGLWALLGIPVIIALHMFRRRYTPKHINALFLFGDTIQDVSSGRTREKVRLSRSLLAEICMVLALTWYLSDPYFSATQEARHIIVILDTHQRLQAHDADLAHSANLANGHSTSVHTDLQQTLNNICERLSSHDRMTLIASGRIPQLLTAAAVSVSEARATIPLWHATSGYHSYQASWRMARDISSASDHAQVFFLSDHQPTDMPTSWHPVSAGTSRANSGFVDARWFHDAAGQRIAVRIFCAAAPTPTSSSSSPSSTRQRHIRLYDDNGTVLATQTLPLPKTSGVHTVLFHLDRNSTIEHASARLSGSDALALDDHCEISKNNRRHVAVYIDPHCPRYAAVRRGMAACADVRLCDTLNEAQICVGVGADNDDGKRSEQIPASCWRVNFTTGTGESVLGPFLTRSGHPLLRDIDCTGILWTQPAIAASLDAGAQRLVRAGAQALITTRQIHQRHQITLHIDMHTSSLTQHPAWPSLCDNLVRWRQSFVPGLNRHTVPLQQHITAILPADATALTLHHPDGTQHTLRAQRQQRVDIPGQLHSGVYRLSLVTDADLDTGATTAGKEGGEKDGKKAPLKYWRYFSVHSLHQHTSDLSACTTHNRYQPLSDMDATDGTAHVQRLRSRSEHMVPLLIALAAAFAAWFFYKRENRASRTATAAASTSTSTSTSPKTTGTHS